MCRRAVGAPGLYQCANASRVRYRTARHLIGDEHRASVFQPPDRPRVRQLAVSRSDIAGKDFLDPLGEFELLGRGDSIGQEVKLDPRCPGVSPEGIWLRRPVEVAR